MTLSLGQGCLVRHRRMSVARAVAAALWNGRCGSFLRAAMRGWMTWFSLGGSSSRCTTAAARQAVTYSLHTHMGKANSEQETSAEAVRET